MNAVARPDGHGFTAAYDIDAMRDVLIAEAQKRSKGQRERGEWGTSSYTIPFALRPDDADPSAYLKPWGGDGGLPVGGDSGTSEKYGALDLLRALMIDDAPFRLNGSAPPAHATPNGGAPAGDRRGRPAATNGATQSRPIHVDDLARDAVDLYVYNDAMGHPVVLVKRSVNAAGEKRFAVYRPADEPDHWVAGGLAGRMDYPLYGLPELLDSAPDVPVWFVEGEECAHLLREALARAAQPSVVTTTIYGAEKSFLTDLTPLAGREVWVLPDHDQPGVRHARDVATIARACGARDARIVPLPGELALDAVPDKHGRDIADWLRDGNDLGSLIATAQRATSLAPGDDRPAANADGDVKCCAPKQFESAVDPLGCSDDANARRMAFLYRHRLRWCPEWKSWLAFDGRRWQRTGAEIALGFARLTARGMWREAAQLSDDGARVKLTAWAKKSLSRYQLLSMIELAKADMSVDVAHFDADPHLLNVLNGTLELRTGELRAHSPDDLLTKLAPVDWDRTATSERWDRFLDDMTGGDEELRGYMQRAAGSSLLGTANDEVVFVCHGPGATGKSTFLDAVAAAMGDYAAAVSSDALVNRGGRSDVRPEIAKLEGVRFAYAEEFAAGQQFDEALLKAISGGSQISVRALYQNPRTFRPAFTLWIGTNERAAADFSDTAIWRRVRSIPFDHVVPVGQRDPSLKADLRTSDLAAVLTWMVAGLKDYLANGLGSAAAVDSSTERYRTDMDPLGDWLEERCEKGADYFATTDDLYADFLEHGHRSLTRVRFGRALSSGHGLDGAQRRHDGRVRRGYEGIRLASGIGEEEADDMGAQRGAG